jgi:hypothetical protein
MSRVASGGVEVVMCDAYIDDPEYSVGSAPMGCRCVRIASRHVMVRGARVDLCEGCYVLLEEQPERVFRVDGDLHLVPLVKDEEGTMPIYAKWGYAQPDAPENPVPPSQRAVYGNSEDQEPREAWCATECHRGARPGCTQSELGNACVPDLRDRISALEDALGAARGRLRETAQILIEEVGCTGGGNAEGAARLAVAKLRSEREPRGRGRGSGAGGDAHGGGELGHGRQHGAIGDARTGAAAGRARACRDEVGGGSGGEQ